MPIVIHSDAFSGRSTQTPEINNFLSTQWRLPQCGKRWRYHREYRDAAGSGLGYALRWLGTQVSIVDPVIEREFPAYVQSLLRGLIHIYRSPQAGFMQRQWNKAANVLDDSRAEDFLKLNLAPGATPRRAFADWFRLGFYEVLDRVQIKNHHLGNLQLNDARNIRFAADIPYELVLFVGRNPIQAAPDAPPQENLLARGLLKSGGMVTAGVSEWGIACELQRWFKVGLYVPDVWVLQKMEPSTKNLYLKITGRSNPRVYDADADVYWHLSGWERALELAKIPFWAVKKAAKPMALAKGVAATTGASLSPDARKGDASEPKYRPGTRPWSQEQQLWDGGAGDSAAGPVTYATALWTGQTDKFNRKSFVPPNYCFVKFNCLLYVRVVAVNPPDA